MFREVAEHSENQVKLTNEDVVEWQYRFHERLGMLAEDRRPTQKQIDLATSEANDWLTMELTGCEPEPKQRLLYVEDVEREQRG